MSNQVIETLKKGLERVRRGSTQGCNARDAEGHPTGQRDDSQPPPACWCVFGAVECDGAANRELSLTLGDDANAIEWNDSDGRTQAEVIDLFERTIARLERGAA
jgi:hypothetical protein